MNPTLKSRPCEKCTNPFEYEPAMWGSREIFVPKFCDPCIAELRKAEEAEAVRDRLGSRREAWREICPPLYQQTDISHPGLSQAAKNALEAWNPSKGRSLGLQSTTGRGKTRLAFRRLKELHMDGWNVFAISARRLARMIAWQFSDGMEKSEAQTVLIQTRTCQVLLLDDLGKEKFTERVAGEFYELVEYRHSYGLPIIWTSNASGSALQERLGEEHGETALRRLLEFSEVIKA